MEREVRDKLKELYQKQRELLMHCVGMTYRTPEALKLKLEIEKLQQQKKS